MLNFKMLRPLGSIMAKIEVKNLMEQLKGIDLKAADGVEKLGFVLIEVFATRLGDTVDDLIELAAIYKNKTVEEAAELNPIEVFKEMFSEGDIGNFLKLAYNSAKQK